MRLFRIALVWAGLVAVALPVPAQEKKPLVTRDRVQLNLAGAEAVLEAAKKKAAALGLKCNVAVVDDGGHMLAFARMDGARPASAATALSKAVSAATFRQETGPLPAKGEPDVLLSLSIQNASGGKITALKGGVPIVIDGQVVGAVGVGGGTGEQDAEVAKAGIQALLDALGQRK
jgi:glc operon protein GlcG